MLAAGRSTRPRSRRPRSPGRRSRAARGCSAHRVGRGQAGGHRAPRLRRRLADAQRADDAAAPAQRVSACASPPGGRGLAVGAGDGDHLAAARWAGRRTRAAIGAALLPSGAAARRCAHRRSRRPRRRRPRPGRRPRRPAAPPATKRRASCRIARPGDEGIAGRAPGGCRCAACRARAGPASARRRRALGSAVSAMRHQKLSRSAAAGLLATICGVTSRSGGTPIMRSVCCTTWLNTGAATSPP